MALRGRIRAAVSAEAGARPAEETARRSGRDPPEKSFRSACKYDRYMWVLERRL